MSSQNTMTLPSPQVFVNKAARKIVIERKQGDKDKNESKTFPTSTNSTEPVEEQKILKTSPTSVKISIEGLEEGEIDSNIPTTSAPSVLIQKPVENNSNGQDPRVPSPNDNSTVGTTENVVQRKLTALEKLKSLNFSAPKSSVNPFAVSAPKSTLTPADYRNDKKPPPQPDRQSSPPIKKFRPFTENSGPRFRQFDHDSRRQERRFTPERNFNMRPPNDQFIRFHEFHGPMPYSDIPNTQFMRGDVWCSPNDLQEPGMVQHRRSPLPPRAAVVAPKMPPLTNEILDESLQPSQSSICWERVRDLTLNADELSTFSMFDLRTVVQHLLDEETRLIQLHLRLQDQIKNVRRTLDREKQIEQLKKQAFTSALMAKQAAEKAEASMRKRSLSKDQSLAMEIDNKLQAELISDVSGHLTNQNEFEYAFVNALKHSIDEQVAARKAHLHQYVNSVTGHRPTPGTSIDYSSGRLQPSREQLTLPKEKYEAMLKSFFDGVASMT